MSSKTMDFSEDYRETQISLFKEQTIFKDFECLKSIKFFLSNEVFDCFEHKLHTSEIGHRNEYLFRIFSTKYSISKIGNLNKDESFELYLLNYIEDDKEIIVNRMISENVEDIYNFLSKYNRIVKLKKEIKELELEVFEAF